MIWFKHFTGYRNDPKVRALREEFKSDGYALPIMMVEIVAESLGPTNPVPFLTYSKAVWAEFVGMDVRKFSKIIAKMQDISLFDVIVEPDGRITFGSDKILKYCDEYTSNLKRKGKIPNRNYRDMYRERSADKSPDRSRVRSRIEVEKKKDLTPSRIEAEGLDAPADPQVDDETTRAEGLKMIREAAEAIGKIGGDNGSTQRRRVVESQDPLPSIETPEGMEDETIEKEQRLRDLGIEDAHVEIIINAWLCIKTERFDNYALASTLNRLRIDGLERSKVYQALEVV